MEYIVATFLRKLEKTEDCLGYERPVTRVPVVDGVDRSADFFTLNFLVFGPQSHGAGMSQCRILSMWDTRCASGSTYLPTYLLAHYLSLLWSCMCLWWISKQVGRQIGRTVNTSLIVCIVVYCQLYHTYVYLGNRQFL